MTIRTLAAWVVLLALGLPEAGALPVATGHPDDTEPPPHRLVLVLEDGRVRTLPPDSPPTPEDLEGATHAWSWTDDTPPRRAEIGALQNLSEPVQVGRLRVVVPPPEADRRAERGLIAAPTEMWEQVPEGLLPRFTLAPEATGVDVPVVPGRPWRLRAVAPGEGSWWVDVAPGTSTVTVATTPAQEFTLEVVGTESGPLPDARVSVLAGHAERGDLRKLADYRTAQDGRLVIPALPGAGELVLLASADGHAPASDGGRPRNLPSRLELTPGTTVSGRFVSQEGLPLHAVRVRVVSWVADELPIPISRWRVTGPDGRWEFPALPRRRVELSSHAAERMPWSRVLELEGRHLDVGDITLAAAHQLRLTLVDDTGSPVPGARVKVDGRWSGAVSDEDGRAWVDLAPAKTAGLIADAAGHRAAELRLTPPLPEQLRLELTRAFIVRGLFVDADGTPVPDAEARVVSGNRIRDTELADGGVVELELEPGVAHRVELRSPRTPVLELPVDPGLPGEVRDLGRLRAPPGLAVTGRLLHADTAAPVAGARVWVPRPSEQGPLVAWMLGDVLETRSDTEGVFELAGLPTVPVTLRIERAGLARRMMPLVPEPGTGRVDLGDVELGSGVELIVRLIEDEDRPDGDRDDAQAMAAVDLGGHDLGADVLRAPVIDGTARIANVPPGERTVAIFRGDRFLCEATADLTAHQDTAEIDCHSRSLTVTGHVDVGGRPAGPGLLVWSAPAGDAAVPEAIMTFGSGPLRRQTLFSPRRPDVRLEVDEDGRFATRALRPGTWRVVWMPYTGATFGPVEVEIPVSDAYLAVVRYPARTVSGVVVDSEGQPVEGARVHQLDGPAFARSTGGGSFVLAGLEPGVHRIRAHTVDRTSATVEVTLDPDRPAEPVELVLGSKDPELRLTVATTAGLPASGALVFLEQAPGTGLRILTADGDGRVAVPLRPPVPARLRAAAHHEGSWALGEWIDPARASAEVRRLTVPEPGTLLLLARESAGRPAIEGPHGWNLTALLSWLGSPPRVTPSSPLHLPGLPPGSYTVQLGDRTTTLSVERGETTEIELE